MHTFTGYRVHHNDTLGPFKGGMRYHPDVGAVTAETIAEYGGRVVAVSTSRGGVYNPKGLDLSALERCYQEEGSFDGYDGAEYISTAEVLEVPCDVLVPAAVFGVVHQKNAERLRCRILAEGANGPTTVEADRILHDRGVWIIPDILANAGGVIVSYFEWVQDLQNFFWDLNAVLRQIKRIITQSFEEVYEVRERDKVTMRMAALIKGIRKVMDAIPVRGLYP